MRTFELEMERAGALRPSNIEGADELSTLYQFINSICPWHFNAPMFLNGRRSREQLEEVRMGQQRVLERYLEFWGC